MYIYIFKFDRIFQICSTVNQNRAETAQNGEAKRKQSILTTRKKLFFLGNLYSFCGRQAPTGPEPMK